MSGQMLLHHIIERESRTRPDELAVVSGSRRVTFKEFGQLVDQLANALRAAAPANARVAVLADNCIEYLAAYYAAPKAGMVMTVLNQRLHPTELAWIVNDVEASVVLGQSQYLTPLMSHRAVLNSVEHWVGIDDGGDVSLDEFLSSGLDGINTPTDPVRSKDTAWIVYTSGTTGRPKGAMLSHRALLQTSQSTAFALDMRRGDQFLFPFPMCHVGGYLLIGTHLLGGAAVLQAGFRPDEWLDLVEAERPTTSALAPTMISMLLADTELDTRDLSSLRWIVYGASSMPRAVLTKAMDRFGVDFQQGYGGTEMGGFTCVLDGASHRNAVSGRPELLSAAGQAMPFVDVRVVDQDMRDVPDGELGEIIVRGEQVMSGYWADKPGTDRAFDDGWLRTGDIARRDQSGYVHIVDRMNDMIVTGAENVYPREVEEVLYSHHSVLEATVFPVPDDKWVDAVAAAVVLHPGASLGVDEIVDHCRMNLASYKKPRHVVFFDALPKNNMGKIERRKVREAAIERLSHSEEVHNVSQEATESTESNNA